MRLRTTRRWPTTGNGGDNADCHRTRSPPHHRPTNPDAHRDLLEPDAGKPARPVLRGPRRSNASGLPDGSRHRTQQGEIAGRHLFAVIDQHSRVVLGQLAVDITSKGKTEGK